MFDDVVIDVSLRYGARSAVVVVEGELDVLTAPDLGTLLEGVIAGGHQNLVLDLASVTLLGAAGVRVIATALAAAREAGGGLTVRAASPVSTRVLRACSMGELIGLEHGRSRVDDGALRPRSPIATLLATAAANDVIEAVLGALTALAQGAVAAADGVSVTLARNGQMTTVGASNETIAQMDRDQYATGEGPCLAAAAQGERIHVRSIATEGRWPQFVQRAQEHGIASILSTPLVVDGRAIGALNIYSNTDQAFGEADEDTASDVARQASAILAETAVSMSDAEFAERLRGALDAREVIARAQGALMARGGMTAEDAYASLRISAREAEQTVRERAIEVMAPVAHPRTTGEAPA